MSDKIGHDRGSQVRSRLAAGAKEIRTLRPTLNDIVPRDATWVPRASPGCGVAPSWPFCGDLHHGIGRRDAFVLWAFECSHADRVEVYQNWQACKAIGAQMATRHSDSRSWFGLVGEDRCPPGAIAGHLIPAFPSLRFEPSRVPSISPRQR